MKYTKLIGALGLSIILPACQSTQHKTELKTLQDSVSYSIGMDIGRNLKGQMIDVNPDALAQALKDMTGDGKPMLTDAQARSAMMAFQTQMMATHAEKMKAAGEKNKKDGETFLAENKKKDGVVTLPSGLQYKVMTAGNGKKPTAKDKVTLNYRGMLIDGTEFDNSYKRGEPAVFPVGGVIKGLSEALQLMPVGSKWQIVIPSDIAYGEQGAGAQITPNAVLVFEIELLGIK
jgi:FKBP-type peptidyl-prolyl cis-trans isomerase FklB